MQKILGPIRRTQFTQSTLHQARILKKKGPSLRKIQVKNHHQRSPDAMKFEDRSREETERQQRCARSKAWNLAKDMCKLKEEDKAAFYSPAEEWVLPVAENNRAGGKRVCGGADMHTVSRKDLNSAELETVRISKKSHDGDDVQRRGANQTRNHGFLSKNWTYLSKLELCAFVVSGLPTSSSTTPTPTSSSCSSQDSCQTIRRKSSTRWKYVFFFRDDAAERKDHITGRRKMSTPERRSERTTTRGSWR